jgi:hypothetical protein
MHYNRFQMLSDTSEVKFEDFEPQAFARIRATFGVTDAAYSASFSAEGVGDGIKEKVCVCRDHVHNWHLTSTHDMCKDKHGYAQDKCGLGSSKQIPCSHMRAPLL